MNKTAQKAPALSAIDILAEDHRKVKKIFSDFDRLRESGGEDEKGALVREACDALTVHARVEEEILYPAARKAIDDRDLLDEAEVEHAGARDLIAQLESMRPGDGLYDAKFVVLAENVKHHIREEEGKLFPQLKKSRLDLEDLGRRIARRKEELQTELGLPSGIPPGPGEERHGARAR